jgi:acetoin utilization deacetylase AcuC-like enzyme
MKVVFHESFLETYTGDPAASRGRLNHALALVQEKYPVVQPRPCAEEDVLLVHSGFHLESVRREETVFPMALLAAGATIKASELAWNGEAAFALCRPPGHHASPDSCWGFCYFNNVAIAVQKMLQQERAEKALIIDFDLHYGDGTDNSFAGNPAVIYRHLTGRDNVSFVKGLENFLRDIETDLVAVSAGFDRHVKDWGGLLTTEDYGAMGAILGAFAREKCQGRLFAALEGGYNSFSLGESLVAFLDGIASPSP